MKLRSIFISLFIVSCVSTISISAQTTVDTDVTALLKKKRSYNKKKGFGFRIQLYYGVETKARIELKKFNIEFPHIKTHIDYSNPPDWKSLVGSFKTRLEADKVLNEIKTKFPSAIVVPR